jgi:hypothetical protein
MKTNREWRIALLTGMMALLGLSSGSAQTSLDFYAFETNGVSNLSDLDYIDLNALIVSTTGGVSIEVRNNSVIGNPGVTSGQPTVTKIFFEDQASVLSSSVSITGSAGQVSFVRRNNLNLPGGNKIGFDVETAFKAVSPQPLYGLDPGESIVFQFSGTNYDALVASLYSGDFRLAMHVQQIGLCGEDSASFVNVIPEPSSAMLGMLGALMLLRRRR